MPNSARRNVVVTPAPAFGSSVYRFEQPSAGLRAADADNSESLGVPAYHTAIQQTSVSPAQRSVRVCANRPCWTSRVRRSHSWTAFGMKLAPSGLVAHEPEDGARSTNHRQRQSMLQGWTTPEDTIKGTRGAAVSLEATSNMIRSSQLPLPASSLLDISVRCANEQRLEELYQLYLRRNHIMPGPGTHDVRFARHGFGQCQYMSFCTMYSRPRAETDQATASVP